MNAPVLAALVDDAAMFPPARRPKEEAAAGHRVARTGPWAWLVGRFLCPASALPVEAVRLGVVSDGEWRADLAAAVAAGAEAFELRDPGPEAYPELAAAPLAVFVEGADVAALAAAGLGAKLRCGGVTADAFPEDRVVAACVGTCRHHGGGAPGRGLFDAFGSCSLSEPADGLAAAGVGAEAPARA